MQKILAVEKDTISIALVHEALKYASQKNVDIDAILISAGIDPADLNHLHQRVSTRSFAQLWVHLSDALNDEFFGLDQHPMRRGSYRLISKLIYTKQTLKSALLDILNALNLILDDFHGNLELDDQHAKIMIRDRVVPKSMFAYATYLMLIHTLLCWLVDQRLLIQRIDVRCQQPTHDQDYRVRFTANIHYNCEQNCIYLDRHYLDLKIKKTRQDWYQFLKNTPENLLVRFKNPHSISYQIRQQLTHSSAEHWPELLYFAHYFNMSEATLQRRLKQEGCNYQQLKNDIRCDLATELLAQTDYSLDQISGILAFHDVSAFSRAFKKWTGITPSQYRQKTPLVKQF